MADPTLAEIRSAYLTNASYEEDASVAEARAFVTACRRLLVVLPSHSGNAAGDGRDMSITEISRAMKDAARWRGVNDSARAGARVTFVDFGEMDR